MTHLPPEQTSPTDDEPATRPDPKTGSSCDPDRPLDPAPDADGVAFPPPPSAPAEHPEERRVRRRRAHAAAKDPQEAVRAALTDLIRRFGEPEIRRFDRCQMFVWRRPTGTGVIPARLSSQDAAGNETALGQLGLVVHWMADQHGLEPRVLILTVQNSGANDIDDRPDLLLAAELMAEPWCDWIAWRTVDRIAREHHPAEEHWRDLRRRGVDLYVYRPFHRRIDWSTDMPELRRLLGISTGEREELVARMADGHEATWLETGRGHHGYEPIGLRRGPDRFLEIDPAEHRLVLEAFRRYAAVSDDDATRMAGPASLRQVCDDLAAMPDGARLTPTQLGTILRDPLYVHGRHSCNARGRTWTVRDIAWPETVPVACFERVQHLLDLRGGALRDPARDGHFLLNGLLVHERCRHLRTADGRHYRLRGSAAKVGAERYYHTPLAAPCCPRYSLSRATVDTAVLGALRRLLLDPDVLDEWNRRRLRRLGLPEDPVRLDEQQARALRGERDRLQTETVDLEQQLMISVGRHANRRAAHLKTRIDEYLDRIGDIEDELASADADHMTDEIRQLAAQLSDREETAAHLAEVLTDEVPDDPELRLQRSGIVRALLDAVVIHDLPDGGYELELQGWPIPDGSARINPVEVIGRAVAGQALATLNTRAMPTVPQPEQAVEGGVSAGEEGLPTVREAVASRTVGSETFAPLVYAVPAGSDAGSPGRGMPADLDFTALLSALPASRKVLCHPETVVDASCRVLGLGQMWRRLAPRDDEHARAPLHRRPPAMRLSQRRGVVLASHVPALISERLACPGDVSDVAEARRLETVASCRAALARIAVLLGPDQLVTWRLFDRLRHSDEPTAARVEYTARRTGGSFRVWAAEEMADVCV